MCWKKELGVTTGVEARSRRRGGAGLDVWQADSVASIPSQGSRFPRYRVRQDRTRAVVESVSARKNLLAAAASLFWIGEAPVVEDVELVLESVVVLARVVRPVG